MILDSTTKIIEIVLGEAITTSQIDVVVAWVDSAAGTTFQPGSGDTVSNGTTPVTVVAAPANGTQRSVREIRVVNRDTVAHDVYAILNDNGTRRYFWSSLSLAANGSDGYAPETLRGPTGSAGPNVLAVGTTTISGGTSGRIEYNNGGTLGELAVGGGIAIAAGTLQLDTRTASTLMGNPTGSPAAPTDIPLGSGLYFSGGTLYAAGGTGTSCWNYSANTAITVGVPPAGDLYWNNATQTSATVVALSHLTNDGYDVDIFIDSIVQGNTLYLQDANSSLNYQTWAVSGSITVHTNSYVEVPVTLSASGGTGTTGFSNNEHLVVVLLARTAAGAAGGVLSGTYPAPGFANIAATSLLANSGTVAAAPSAVAAGAGLGFSGSNIVNTGVISIGGDTGTITLSPNFTSAGNTIQLASTITLPGTAQVINMLSNAGSLYPTGATNGQLVINPVDNTSAKVDLIGVGTAVNKTQFATYGARGTSATPTALQSGDVVFRSSAFGNDGTTWGTTALATFALQAATNWTSSDHSGAVVFSWINGGTSTLNTSVTFTGASIVLSGVNTLAAGANALTISTTGAHDITISAGGNLVLQGHTMTTANGLGYDAIPADLHYVDVPFSHPGTMVNSELVGIVEMPGTHTIPANLTGTGIVFYTAGGYPTASTSLILYSGNVGSWTAQGTLSVSTLGVLSITGAPTIDTNFTGGLSLVGPGTADVTFANWGITVRTKRT